MTLMKIRNGYGKYSPTMQTALKTALNMREGAGRFYSGRAVLVPGTANVNTVVALINRDALVRLSSKAWGVTRRGAEAVGVDYDQLLAELHMQALAENERFRRCPFEQDGCDFTAFGWPSTPFNHHKDITSEDQILYHVNQAHMPMTSAHYLSSITSLDDEVREDIQAFINAYLKAKAFRPADERITDVEQARTAALYEYIERATVTPGEHSLMTTMPKRQFCRKCLKSAVPAITLTFDDGERRLHWCDEHIDDAETYRPHSDQAVKAPAHAVDIPVRGAHHCERTDAHTPHVWSHLGPEPTWYCDGTFQATGRFQVIDTVDADVEVIERATHLPELHGPIADGRGDPVAAEAATFLIATLGDEGWLSGRYAVVSNAGHHPRWAA